jgi:hypothetical protein
MGYGQDKYTDAVKSCCDPQAFKEIEASNERHQKMNNLLLCELVKQIKILNENIYAMLSDEEETVVMKTAVIPMSKQVGEAFPDGKAELDKGVDKFVEGALVKGSSAYTVELPLEIKEQKPVEVPKSIVEKYGIKTPDHIKSELTTPVMPSIPLTDVGTPVAVKKAAFGRIPRHEPSKVSENVSEA